MKRIARVFVTRTAMTPTDPLAFVNCPPPLMILPEIDEVHGGHAMTRREYAILSAYTGYMLLPAGYFDEVHHIIQEAMGRPVYTHEMASEKLQEQIREALRPQVQEIMERAYWEGSEE